MDFYAAILPPDIFSLSSAHNFGPTLRIRMAAVDHPSGWAYTFSGSTVRQHAPNEGTAMSDIDDLHLPEPLARKLYEALQNHYGGVPNNNVQKVLEEALAVERRRVDKVMFG